MARTPEPYTGWSKATGCDAATTRQALSQWRSAGGHMQGSHFVPPLPLGQRLDRDALMGWLADQYDTNRLPRPCEVLNVRRDEHGNVVQARGETRQQRHARIEAGRELTRSASSLLDRTDPENHKNPNPRDVVEHQRLCSELGRIRDTMQDMSPWMVQRRVGELRRRAQMLGTGTVLRAKPVVAPESLTGVPQVLDPARREAALRRIETVRRDFERRRCDIHEVIEHNALFQLSVPQTAAFDEFLVAVTDTALDTLLDTELVQMSARLDTLYRAAVQNAEQTGLDALRDPKLGGTAVKLARTARDERIGDAEREAARTKLEAALRELRLPMDMTGPALDACGPRRELLGASPDAGGQA